MKAEGFGPLKTSPERLSFLLFQMSLLYNFTASSYNWFLCKTAASCSEFLSSPFFHSLNDPCLSVPARSEHFVRETNVGTLVFRPPNKAFVKRMEDIFVLPRHLHCLHWIARSYGTYQPAVFARMTLSNFLSGLLSSLFTSFQLLSHGVNIVMYKYVTYLGRLPASYS